MNRRTFFLSIAGTATALAAANQLRSLIDESTPMKTTPGEITVRLLDPTGSLTAPQRVPKIVKSDAAWKAQLTDEQFRVTRTHGTERAFCGIFHDNHKIGLYTCVGCGLPLFRSDAKFESGTGWPSFFQPVAEENIGTTQDVSFGMARTEIHCARCESHLGHVFNDGPAPTRLRYCMNSAALDFREDGVVAARERVLFGAGCFWGVESAFAKAPGVTATRVGFSGGLTKNPTYDDVCAHGTGHAEVVQVEYDPAATTFDALLAVFWKSHDATVPHRPGADDGSQYRSAIFFNTPAQETVARASLAGQEQHDAAPISTEILLAGPFYAAEEYHQKYYAKHAMEACRIP